MRKINMSKFGSPSCFPANRHLCWRRLANEIQVMPGDGQCGLGIFWAVRPANFHFSNTSVGSIEMCGTDVINR